MRGEEQGRAAAVVLGLLMALSGCQTDCDAFSTGDCRSDQTCLERSGLSGRGRGDDLRVCVDGRCRQCRADRDCPRGQGCHDHACEPFESGVGGLCRGDASCQHGYSCTPLTVAEIEELAGPGTSYVGICTAFGAECTEEGACDGGGHVCRAGVWRPECSDTCGCAAGHACNSSGVCAPDFGAEQICFGDLDCAHLFPDGLTDHSHPDAPLTCVGGGCVDCPTDVCHWVFRTAESATSFRGTIQDIPGYCVEEGSCDGSGRECDLHQWRRDCSACDCPD